MTTLDEFLTQAVEEKHCLFHLRTQLDISQFPLQLGLAMWLLLHSRIWAEVIGLAFQPLPCDTLNALSPRQWEAILEGLCGRS